MISNRRVERLERQGIPDLVSSDSGACELVRGVLISNKTVVKGNEGVVLASEGVVVN